MVGRSLLVGCSLFASSLACIPTANAQSLYCPATVGTSTGTQAGFALTAGSCTNNTIGAFSNAALAAQALSDVSQSASLQTTQVALETISARRRVEAERCPEGLVRQEGECRPVAAPRPAAVSTPEEAPRSTARREARRPRPTTPHPVAPQAPVFKAPVLVETGPRFGTWVRGFGDSE